MLFILNISRLQFTETPVCIARMIGSLPTDVRAQLRSGVTIFSLQQCVEELILNSIDSGATCVAVKMDIGACRVQVIDNGSGMCREDMEKVGIRYNSSKCSTLDDLNNLRFYGFRGEALSSIISLAETVDINSRTKQTVKTYVKTFNEGKESDAVEAQDVRPSSGTTVSVYNLFYNMPVRRKRLDAVLETERIRQRLEAIALMHPSVSFTFKNENSSHMVVQLSKTRNTYYRFVQIHGLTRAQKLGEVSYVHEQFELTGHVGREGHYNNSLQFLFVNGRLLLKTRIHKLLNCLLKRVSSGAKQNNSLTSSPSTASPKQRSTADLYGVYVLNIKCNYAEYDICLEPAKSLIEFKDWDNVLTCVEEGVESFIIKENLETEVMNDADGPTSSPVRSVKTLAEVRNLNVEETLEGFEALTENKDNADGMEVPGGVQIVVSRNTESCSSGESETEKAVQNVTLPARTILAVGSEMNNNCKKDDIYDKHDANAICAKKDSTDINNNKLTESKSCKISILNGKSSGDSLKHFSTPNKLFPPKRKLLLNDRERGDPDSHSFYGPSTKTVKTAAPRKLTLSFEAGSLDNFRKLFGKDAEKKQPTMNESGGLHPDSSQKSNDFSEGSSVDVDGLIRTDCENDEDNIDSTRDIAGSVSAHSKCSAKSSPWNRGDKISLAAKCSHLKQSKTAFKIPQRQQLHPKTLDVPGDVLFESSGTVDSAVNNSLKDIPSVVLTEQSSKIPPTVEDSHLYTSSMTTSGGGVNFGEEAGITSQCDPLSHNVRDEGQTINESDEAIPVSSNWLAHYDNSLGKLVYINQVTGLSKYNSPLVDTQVPCTTDVTNMVVSVISKAGFEYRCYPFQTNIVLPFLPKPRAERAFCSLLDSKEDVQGPNSLSTLFSEWTNPVFIRPPEVALDVTSGQAEGLAVKIHNILFSYRFTKNMIHTMRVINQVDKKFLACLINAEQETSKCSKNEGNLLVLVDQHAAHERVRLEGLVADSYEDDPDTPGKKRLCSSSVTPPLEISVTEEEMRLLRSCPAFLSDLALDVSFQKSDSLNVFLERLPTCFIEKESTELRRGRRSVIKTIAEEYLREQIELLRLTGRVRGMLPLTVHNVLASQACHGAIKFNHILSKEECCSLVSSLSSCQLPFQCAHGRPSIIPIADLHHIEGQEDLPKPNLRKLRRMYKAWQLYGKDTSLS